MSTRVEVHFHGIEKSAAVEQRVRDKVARLGKHFSRMTSCRVAIEAAQRSADKPKVYLVKIEIAVPRRATIVVRNERTGGHAHTDLPLAIRDAFGAAMRKVDGMSAKIGQRSKLERGRRRPARPSQSEASDSTA